MLNLTNSFNEQYNYLIHVLFDRIVFNYGIYDDEDIGDNIQSFAPKYLFREQYKKCLEVIEDLYYWSDDTFIHDLDIFHKVLLYRFLEYCSNVQKESKNKYCFFDKEAKKIADNAAKLQKKIEEKYLDEKIELQFYKDNFLLIENYLEVLFEDSDFDYLDYIYNERFFKSTKIQDYLNINIGDYFDILPMDIQKKHSNKHITLSEDVGELLNYIIDKSKNGNLNQLFWENNIPINENRIHVVLENIFEVYFHSKKVDITREAVLGNGKVDFKFYKNNDFKEKVLIEVKKANNQLKKGYVRQLEKYISTSKFKYVFYLIVCFTDADYNRAEKFITENVYTKEYHLYINIHILDVRIRKVPSQ